MATKVMRVRMWLGLAMEDLEDHPISYLWVKSTPV